MIKIKLSLLAMVGLFVSCSSTEIGPKKLDKVIENKVVHTKFQSRYGREFWFQVLENEKQNLSSSFMFYQGPKKTRFVFIENEDLSDIKVYSLRPYGNNEFDQAAAQKHLRDFAHDKINFESETNQSFKSLWKAISAIEENFEIDKSNEVQLLNVLASQVDVLHIISGKEVIKKFQEAMAKEKLSKVEKFSWEAPSQSTSYNPGQGQFNLNGSNSLYWASMLSPEYAIDSKEYLQNKFVFTILFAGKSSYFYSNYVEGKRKYFLNMEQGELSLGRKSLFFVSGNMQSKSKVNSLKKNIAKNAFEICDESITSRHYLRAMNQLGVNFLKTVNDESKWKQKLYHILVYGSAANYLKSYHEMFSLTMDDLRPACSKFLTAGNPLIYTLWKKNK